MMESARLFCQSKSDDRCCIGNGPGRKLLMLFMKDPRKLLCGQLLIQIDFEDPENKAFWSVTVYDKKGFRFIDLANSLSSHTTQMNEDGT